jgi:hypothetical protein
MREITSSNFGLLIAYLVPGLTALWGASYVSPTIRLWLAATPSDAPTVGGFLYLTIGSMAAGLTVSTIRWATIDTLHRLTGLRPPKVDFARLQEHIDAYHLFVEWRYRYYQFYANSAVALSVPYVLHHTIGEAPFGAYDLAFWLLEAVFLAGSRDTLRQYHDMLRQALGATTTVRARPARSVRQTRGVIDKQPKHDSRQAAPGAIGSTRA